MIQSNVIVAQESESANKQQVKPYKGLKVGLIQGGGYLTSVILLNKLWYDQFNQSSFHFYNDNKDWLLMDKVGHFYSSYYLASVQKKIWNKSFSDKRTESLVAAGTAWVMIASIEILDGYSTGWGASVGDLGANTLGIALFTAQDMVWKEQRIYPKFSYFPSKYADYRPELLGKTWNERVLKDYNAQSYWVSFNPWVVAGDNSCCVPDWFMFSFGYSGDGMLGGSKNPEQNSKGEQLPYFERQGQWMFSFDIDLRRLPVEKPWLRRALNALNCLKIPVPSIMIQGGKLSVTALPG